MPPALNLNRRFEQLTVPPVDGWLQHTPVVGAPWVGADYVGDVARCVSSYDQTPPHPLLARVEWISPFDLVGRDLAAVRVRWWDAPEASPTGGFVVARDDATGIFLDVGLDADAADLLHPLDASTMPGRLSQREHGPPGTVTAAGLLVLAVGGYDIDGTGEPYPGALSSFKAVAADHLARAVAVLMLFRDYFGSPETDEGLMRLASTIESPQFSMRHLTTAAEEFRQHAAGRPGQVS